MSYYEVEIHISGDERVESHYNHVQLDNFDLDIDFLEDNKLIYRSYKKIVSLQDIYNWAEEENEKTDFRYEIFAFTEDEWFQYLVSEGEETSGKIKDVVEYYGDEVLKNMTSSERDDVIEKFMTPLKNECERSKVNLNDLIEEKIYFEMKQKKKPSQFVYNIYCNWTNYIDMNVPLYEDMEECLYIFMNSSDLLSIRLLNYVLKRIGENYCE